MADIFTVTAPLKVRLPSGELHIIAELFKHPEGLLYFDLLWHMDRVRGVHLLKGEITGEGPWKIGDHIFYVLGCRGTDAELASEYSEWQTWRQMHPEEYPDERMVRRIAENYGAITQ